MYKVNSPFLFKGKRYKEGQLLSDDHTAVKYRTHFVDKVEAKVEAANASTKPPQAKEVKVVPPTAQQATQAKVTKPTTPKPVVATVSQTKK
jgi:hypothetical protein